MEGARRVPGTKRLATTGACVQQNFLLFWPCEVSSFRTLCIRHFTSPLNSDYFAIIIAALGSYTVTCGSGLWLEVCSTFVAMTELLACGAARGLTAAVFLRRYVREMRTAGAWRRACAASAPRRPAPPPGCSSQRPSTCGLMVHGLLRLHLGRSQPPARTLWLVCQCSEPGGAAGRCRADAARARRHAVFHSSLCVFRAGTHGHSCSMAACLRGVGPAMTCAASWLQLTEAIHLWSDGAWPAQAAPGQVTTIGLHAVARVPVF